MRVFAFVAVGAWGELLRERLNGCEGLEVVESSCESASALAQTVTMGRADVFLVDAFADGALETARAIARLETAPRIVVLGLDEDPATALAWAMAGASGLVARTAGVEELIAALASVAHGEAPCSPKVITALLRGVGASSGPAAPKQSPRLTAREREVARLLADGLTNKEIATILQIEPGTVKCHVHSIIRKLQVSRRAQVAAVFRGDGGLQERILAHRVAASDAQEPVWR